MRREEVAQRANVSVTWYTWLEQGRSGKPSADMLERIARALQLTDAEREHMFLISQHRPPGLRPAGHLNVTPRLQRVIDALLHSPAIVKEPDWTIVAWNRAASLVLTDYAALPTERRNIVRLLFDPSSFPIRNAHWESQARAVIASLRLQCARAGTSNAAQALADELGRESAEFADMWKENEVEPYGDGIKYIEHSRAGSIALEYSSFAVDGQPDLELIIYNPATSYDVDRIRKLIDD